MQAPRRREVDVLLHALAARPARRAGPRRAEPRRAQAGEPGVAPQHRVSAELRARGEHFGFPWCAAGFQDPGAAGPARLCSEFPAPDAVLGPHVAPIGTHFYRGTAFPERYRNALFIANQGSWNRPRLSGFNVVVVREGQVVEGWSVESIAADRVVISHNGEVVELRDSEDDYHRAEEFGIDLSRRPGADSFTAIDEV